MDNDPSSRNTEGIYEPFDSAIVPLTRHRHGARFGMDFQYLSRFGGGSAVGVALEVLPPGLQANPAHYHMLEEEHVYVLDGSMTLLLGEREYLMEQGHYVCFPPGQKAGHALINRTAEPCRYLIIGSRHPHDVSIHTDTGRVSVKLTGEAYRGSATMDYWDGVDSVNLGAKD